MHLIQPKSHELIPDFFVVGHPKCGTTALYKMLGAHPQIFMPVKEPRFFSPDVKPRTRSLQEYLDLFAGVAPGQVIGEADPHSLTSRVAPSAIAAHNPAARIIALFREPASFLQSLHLQQLRSHPETVKDLRSAIDLYIDYTHYAEQLHRYRAALPENQILVVIYDDFRQDNPGTLRQVLDFLGVESTCFLPTIESNSSFAYRRPLANTMLLHLLKGEHPAFSPLQHVLKTVIPRPARQAAIKGFKRRIARPSPPHCDEALAAELRRRFKPEVVQLGDLLGRDLATLWGYDNA
ncbi:MAG: sulfotransferase family protein [bacterium]